VPLCLLEQLCKTPEQNNFLKSIHKVLITISNFWTYLLHKVWIYVVPKYGPFGQKRVLITPPHIKVIFSIEVMGRKIGTDEKNDMATTLQSYLPFTYHSHHRLITTIA